jgi:hypothetical protein
MAVVVNVRTDTSPLLFSMALEMVSYSFLFLFFVCLFVCFVFEDRVSLCSPGCPGTHFVDQADLELRNLPASASPVLGLKASATTARWFLTLKL